MHIEHKFVYRWPPGVKPILFEEWVELLPPDRKTIFREAERQQHQYRQDAIDSGDLRVVPTESYDVENCKGHQQYAYIWTSPEAEARGKESNKLWKELFLEYLAVTGTIFEIEKHKT